MSDIRSMFFVSVFAGLLAGLLLTGLQALFTVPRILQAEQYEQMVESVPLHEHSGSAEGRMDSGHDHGEGWKPENGAPRLAFTAVANVVTAVGFGLLLVAMSEFSGGIKSWHRGLLWGLAGFAVFTLAPGLGLPPELPGMPGAVLETRQIWWVGCVVATGGGLALIIFGQGILAAVAGVALIVAPHLIGAPTPESYETLVPEDLHHQFVVAVTMVNLVFWLTLGAAIGMLRPRFADRDNRSLRQA